MLEEDAMRFDAFLKDNDKKAHDALTLCVFHCVPVPLHSCLAAWLWLCVLMR